MTSSMTSISTSTSQVPQDRTNVATTKQDVEEEVKSMFP